MGAWKDIKAVALRELAIWRMRPIYLVGSLMTLVICTVFFTSFFRQGLPQELPIGIVDNDNSSMSRSFVQQLGSTQQAKIVRFETFDEARAELQRGKITSFVVLPERMYADVTASRQPTVSLYVNGLYFIGGALAYQDVLTMLNLTNGAVQRTALRAKGMNEAAIMGQIKPIEVDTHKIGNPMTNYAVLLEGVLLPGVLQMIIFLIIIYSFGAELKYATSQHLLAVTHGSMSRAILGKLLVYTLYFSLLGVSIEVFMYHRLAFPLEGSLGNMIIAVLLLVLSSEAFALFIIGLLPVCRLGLSIGALFSMVAFSMTGFTLPVEAMPPYIQGLSAIFPLRHYYLFMVQETIFGSGFAGWWPHALCMLLFLFLPFIIGKRLKNAYVLQNYSRN